MQCLVWNVVTWFKQKTQPAFELAPQRGHFQSQPSCFLFYTTLISFHISVGLPPPFPVISSSPLPSLRFYSHFTNPPPPPLLSAISRIISLFNCCWLKPSYSPAAQHSSNSMLLQPCAIQLPLGRLNQAERTRTVWALYHSNTTLDRHQTMAPGIIKRSSAVLLIWTWGDWEVSTVQYDNLLFIALI